MLSSDLYVDGPVNNNPYGHVDLALAGPTPFSGPLYFFGGTGRFSGFHARINVVCDPILGSPCTWDGPYYFTPPGHDQ